MTEVQKRAELFQFLISKLILLGHKKIDLPLVIDKPREYIHQYTYDVSPDENTHLFKLLQSLYATIVRTLTIEGTINSSIVGISLVVTLSSIELQFSCLSPIPGRWILEFLPNGRRSDRSLYFRDPTLTYSGLRYE